MLTIIHSPLPAHMFSLLVQPFPPYTSYGYGGCDEYWGDLASFCLFCEQFLYSPILNSIDSQHLILIGDARLLLLLSATPLLFLLSVTQLLFFQSVIPSPPQRGPTSPP